MKTWERGAQHLEGLYGPTAPLPWETPGWEQWSDTARLGERKQYVAAYPDSARARQWHAMEARTDSELEALLAAAKAQRGEGYDYEV